ncbi:putative transcription factor Trihelix family [Helianthus annuus]|nr:putative transcription factor Trihelix family [Helianthus annuus]
MENNGMFSNTLGLEMTLTHHHQTPNFLHQQPPYAAAVKPATDEETNNPATTDDSGGDGKLRKGSPWQRMKWTDNMVRLLIMVVFYVGDEAGSEQPPAADTAARKKGGGGGGGGVMQKKGKWKSVSLAMMERGFYVSPQQCEDKFNDLNKRYKRVNDILGKGTACKVVENQSLLESMDHIPVKLKEEVKKLLNSKHLFFREMCAYHNSCGGGSGGGGGGGGGSVGHHPSPPEVETVERQHSHHRPNCVHSNDDEDEEEDDEGDDENEEDGDREEEEDDGLSTRKRARAMENGDVIRQFSGELSSVVQDLTKSVWEKRQWMKVRMMQLEEQRVGVQGESYELEKRRSKWLKFSYSKEREMEIEKLKNERMKLENERMVLLLRQKEMELVDHQQQQYSSNVHKRTSDPSSING